MRSSTQVRKGRSDKTAPSSKYSRLSPNKKKSRLEYRRRLRAILRELVWDYKVQHSCVDCGESDPRCLDFDHRDPAMKKFEISNMSAVVSSIDTLVAEIEKCDIRCANCHRKRTYDEQHSDFKALES